MDKTTTYAPPASRNAPCPCGSGRRWKECHGRAAAAPQVGPDGATTVSLQGALAAQQAGRVAEAIAIYDTVIASHPEIFDAWHMRGVAHFQLLAFDAAERDIRRALEIAPALDAARRNLALVLQGRRIADEEAVLCREVLPRYLPLAVDPAVPPLEGVDAATRVVVLAAGASAAAIDALVGEGRQRGATIARIDVERGRVIDGEDAALLAATGGRDVVVCAGCARALGDWTLEARPRATALVVDGPDLATFIDRLREISGQGRRRVRLSVDAGVAIDLRPLPHLPGGA